MDKWKSSSHGCWAAPIDSRCFRELFSSAQLHVRVLPSVVPLFLLLSTPSAMLSMAHSPHSAGSRACWMRRKKTSSPHRQESPAGPWGDPAPLGLRSPQSSPEGRSWGWGPGRWWPQVVGRPRHTSPRRRWRRARSRRRPRAAVRPPHRVGSSGSWAAGWRRTSCGQGGEPATHRGAGVNPPLMIPHTDHPALPRHWQGRSRTCRMELLC